MNLPANASRAKHLLIGVLLLTPFPGHGQTRAPGTPEQALHETFRALSDRRWRDAAAMIHPEAAAGLIDERVQLARSMASRPQVNTAAAPLVGVPACVAEFFNSMTAVASRSGLSREFANVDSVSALEKLGQVEAMARWIEAHDPGERMRAFRLPAPPGMQAPASEPRVERAVLGTVMEDDSLAHVTYRETQRLSGNVLVEQAVRAVSLRRTEQGWRLLLNEALFGYRPLPLPIPAAPQP